MRRGKVKSFLACLDESEIEIIDGTFGGYIMEVTGRCLQILRHVEGEWDCGIWLREVTGRVGGICWRLKED